MATDLERIPDHLQTRIKVLTDLKKMDECDKMNFATTIPANDTNATCCGITYGIKLETTGATWGNTAKYFTNREIQRRFNLDNMRLIK